MRGEGGPEPGGSPSGRILRELFDEALALAAPEREAFVRERTADDPALRRELEQLLHHADAVGPFLARPIAGQGVLTDGLESTPTPAVAQAPGLLEPGDRVGDHEIVSFLARGGGGQVFRARQLSLGGRMVALKVVGREGFEASERERFLRGTHVAAEVHHPSLVEVYTSGEDPERGLLYCSMRLVEGLSLQEVLRSFVSEKRCPDASERRMLVERCAEVAGALAALHERGAIHRDVKPANIMIEGGSAEKRCTGRAVLVDFGLVRSLLGPETQSTALGTLPYAAPELLLEGRVDECADVYALGLCLYDLCAGKAPSERTGASAEIEPLSTHVPGLEPALEAVVHCAIEPHPRHRYPNAGALRGDLSRWLAGRSVRAPRLRGFGGLRRHLRHHPERALRGGLRLLLAGVAATAIVLGGIYSFDLWSESRQVRAALESGDLLGLRQAVERIPAHAQLLLLGNEIEPTLTALESQEDPLGAVVREGLEKDEDAALLLAARYLGRDGLGGHPHLVRFLLRALDSREHSSTAILLCARLFSDRPAEVPEALENCEPFRTRLTRMLNQPGIDEKDLLYVLSALAGCGGTTTPDDIHAWILSRPDGAELCEEARLAMRMIEWTGRRSREAGFARAFAERDWDPVLRTFSLIYRQVQSRSAPDYGISQAFIKMACILALYRGLEELPPLAFDPVELPELGVAFRAANQDPELRRQPDRILEDLRFGDLVQAGPKLLAAGWALRMLGEPLSPARVDAWIERLTPGDKSPPFRRLLRGGYEEGEEDIEGLPERLKPDANTRLGAWFEEVRSPWRSSHPEPRAFYPTSGPLLARWEFVKGAPVLYGQATGLDSLSVEFLNDDVPGDIGFACLGVNGRSELRFSLRLGEAARAKRVLFRCQYQKGVRSWLPYGGQAGVIVTFEEQEASFAAGDESDFQQVMLLTPRLGTADGEFVVSMRLNDTSTTTFRVYRVDVLLED